MKGIAMAAGDRAAGHDILAWEGPGKYAGLNVQYQATAMEHGRSGHSDRPRLIMFTITGTQPKNRRADAATRTGTPPADMALPYYFCPLASTDRNSALACTSQPISYCMAAAANGLSGIGLSMVMRRTAVVPREPSAQI